MVKQKIGLATATFLVIANMIGSGIFTSLGFQAAVLPSASVLLVLWMCGGIVALCGGLSYVQLARLYPGSGGEYNYVDRFYPPLVAYATGLISIFAGFAAPVALSAMACSAYISTVFHAVPVKLLAWVLVTLVTLFHCISIRWSGRFQQVSTLIKLGLIFLFIVCGLQVSGHANPFTFHPEDLHMLTSRGFAVSLVYVSFAYSGWNASIYIFHEIKKPERNIWRSIITGTLVVTSLYLLINIVFLQTVPLRKMNNVVEVGAVSALRIFGSGGGKLMAGMIGLLLVSCISAMVWIGPRVCQRMAADLKIGSLSYITAKHIPIRAMGLQYLVTSILLLTGTFEQILSHTGVLLNICSSMAVAILFFRTKPQNWKQLIAPTVYLIMTIYSTIVLLFG